MEKRYIDMESRVAFPEDIQGIPAGKQFDAFVMTCEENGFTSLQRKRNIFLIFEGILPKVEWYPVPSLMLFAHDEAGGYFCHSGEGLESSIYFVSGERECWYLAENFRDFVKLVVFAPNWKDVITGEKTEINETAEEISDLGMLFGFSVSKENLKGKIRKETSFKIYENIEKAREKVSLI